MTYTFIAGRCGDLPVAVCCRVMKVSPSGFYAWRAQPCSDRDWDDAVLTNTIVDIHRMSRRSYGSPRVHAELRLGLGTCCSRKRVERLMRQAAVAGIHRRRRGGCTRGDGSEPSDDLVGRQFDPNGLDRLWVMDVTEHPTAGGKVYLAVVLDAFSRRVVLYSVKAPLAPGAERPGLRAAPPAPSSAGASDFTSADGYGEGSVLNYPS
jgi:putative transposase